MGIFDFFRKRIGADYLWDVFFPDYTEEAKELAYYEPDARLFQLTNRNAESLTIYFADLLGVKEDNSRELLPLMFEIVSFVHFWAEITMSHVLTPGFPKGKEFLTAAFYNTKMRWSHLFWDRFQYNEELGEEFVLKVKERSNQYYSDIEPANKDHTLSNTCKSLLRHLNADPEDLLEDLEMFVESTLIDELENYVQDMVTMVSDWQ